MLNFKRQGDADQALTLFRPLKPSVRVFLRFPHRNFHVRLMMPTSVTKFCELSLTLRAINAVDIRVSMEWNDICLGARYFS